MASTTLDVRARWARPRRLPATVLAAAGIAVVEAIAVVAAALTGLDGLLVAADRPSGALVVLALLALAAWAVLGAGGGLVLADGSGSRLLTAVACAELGLLVTVFVLGVTTSSVDALAPGLPVPALALSALVVPVGKLLLVTTPSSMAWSDAAPRRRVETSPPAVPRRGLRAVTVALIGLALLSVALTDPAGPSPERSAPASTGQH